jgi:hypothetical protein
MEDSPVSQHHGCHPRRDPGGINPDGCGHKSGEDPLGVGPSALSPCPSSQGGELMGSPPTPTHRNTTPTALTAMLMGVPPPPPSDPPPQRTKRGSTPSRLRQDEVLSALNKRSSSCTSGEIILSSFPGQASIVTTATVEDTAMTAYTDKPRSESTIATSPSKLGLIQQRLQAARAIYQSDPLILNPPEGNDHIGRYSASLIPATESSGQISYSTTSATPVGTQIRPLSPTRSLSIPTANSSIEAAPVTVRAFSLSSTSQEDQSTNTKSPKIYRPSTPDARHRSKILERCHQKDYEAKHNGRLLAGQQKRKGFFRKFFGKKGRSGTSVEEENGTFASEAIVSHSTIDGLEYQQTVAFPEPSIRKSMQEAIKPPNGSKDTVQTPHEDQTVFIDNDRPELFFGHDDVSLLTSPTWNSKNRKSEDPVQEVGHEKLSDPMGYYWKKPTENQSTQELNNGSLAIDPFSAPFFHEPAGRSPVTNQTEFLQGKVHVKVNDADGPGDDPQTQQNGSYMATSPIPSLQDPSSFSLNTTDFSEYQFHDPLGESPLQHKHHLSPAPRVDSVSSSDPTIHRNPLSMDHESDEEKKDEENHSSYSDNAANVFPPPPPPLPETATQSKSQGKQRPSAHPKLILKENGNAFKPREYWSKKQTLTMKSSPLATSTSHASVSGSTLHDSDTGKVVDTPDPFSSAKSAPANRTTANELSPSWTVSSVARINAKTVAYIHTLNGDPSPRRTWRKSDAQALDVARMKKQRNTNETANLSLIAKPPGMCVELHKSPNFAETCAISYIANRKTDEPSYAEDIIGSKSVSLGFAIMRERREASIACGASQRVVLVKKNAVPVVDSYFSSFDDPEPRDPIQRAGRRLLAKAAIPIQAHARSFLAQRKAVDRMWALIEIQSYARRWKAEASLLGNRTSATRIASRFRGYKSRVELNKLNDGAIQIQRIVRGYFAAARTYDAVFCIILVQARARGNNVRQKTIQSSKSAIKIQSLVRGFTVRCNFDLWRDQRLFALSQRLQATIKIQAIWRGFQGYTDYIFALVDVLVVQRTVRRWLAQRKACEIRKHRAAVILQSDWRRFSSQMALLYSFVRIIIVQSLARRFLARNALQNKQIEIEAEIAAAIKIQAFWRGFWSFSHFVIIQYESIRLQAIARGSMMRKRLKLQLGCCIMIQAAIRRRLAIKRANNLKMTSLFHAAALISMTETVACQHMQFWWRVVLDCRKEKKAALIIERFFFMVKEEVEKEIRRVKAKKTLRKENRRHRTKDDDENLLERVWLSTVDEDRVGVFAYARNDPIRSDGLAKSPSNKSINRSNRSRLNTVRHRASSPTMNLIMRHDQESKRRYSDPVNRSLADNTSEISGATAVSFGFKRAQMRKTGFPNDKDHHREDLSMVQPQAGTGTRQGKQKENSVEKYLQMYGIKTAPNRSSRVSSFFSDELESAIPNSCKESGFNAKKCRKSTSSIPAGAAGTLYQDRNRPTAPLDRDSCQTNRAYPTAAASPRHGKIQVLHPHPVYAKGKTVDDISMEFVGEEFGMI